MPSIQGRRKGFLTVTDRETGAVQKTVETFGCGHCQHVTEAPHGASLDDLGCFCLACMRPVCQVCTAKMAAGGLCDPFEEKLLRSAASQETLRSMGFGETNTG